MKISKILFSFIFILTSISIAKATELALPFEKLQRPNQVQETIFGQNSLELDIPSTKGLPIKNAYADIIFNTSAPGWSTKEDKKNILQIIANNQLIQQIDIDKNYFAYKVELPKNKISQTDRIIIQIINDNSCSTSNALMSGIDMNASRISFDIDANQVNLTSIEPILKSLVQKNQKLEILAPHGFKTDLEISTAALITQGWALRTSLKEPRIIAKSIPISHTRQWDMLPSIALDKINSPVAVITGTQNDLQDYVSEEILSQITGPYITVIAPEKPQFQGFIIVSGTTTKEVLTAARSLASNYFDWPKNKAAIFDVENEEDTQNKIMPKLPSVIWGPNLKSEEEEIISFDKLNIYTQSFKGTSLPGQEIHILADELLGENRNTHISLNLDYSYGPGLTQDSAWNIFINNRLIRTIPTSNKAGDTTWNHEVSIPTTALKPGVNTLSLIPNFKTENLNGCSLIKDKNLESTLFARSEIKTPYLGGLNSKNSLANWVSTGSPIPSAGYKPTAWIITTIDEKSISSTLTLFARIVSTVNEPMTNVTFTTSWHTPYANKIIIGSENDVLNLLKNNSPQELNSPKMPPVEKDIFDSTLEKLVGTNQDKIDLLLKEVSKKQKSLNNGKDTLTLLTFPDAEKNSTIAIFTKDSNQLEKGIYQLTQNDTWNQLYGDISLIIPNYNIPQNINLNKDKGTIENSDSLINITTQKIKSLGTSSPLVFIGIIFIFFILFGIITVMLTNTKRSKDAEQ